MKLKSKTLFEGGSRTKYAAAVGHPLEYVNGEARFSGVIEVKSY